MAKGHGTPEKAPSPVKSGLASPLYSSGISPSLGEQKVGGPRGGMSTPDPLGFKRGGGKGRKGK